MIFDTPNCPFINDATGDIDQAWFMYLNNVQIALQSMADAFGILQSSLARANSALQPSSLVAERVNSETVTAMKMMAKYPPVRELFTSDSIPLVATRMLSP